MRLRLALAVLVVSSLCVRPSPASEASWSEIAPGVIPPARFGEFFAYDASGDQYVVFGGGTIADDSKLYTLDATKPMRWHSYTPAGSAPVVIPQSAILDPVRHRILFFFRYDDNFLPVSEVWALSLGSNPAWSLVPSFGAGPALVNATVAYDPIRDRVLVFGGSDGTTLHNEVWEHTLSGTPTWTMLTTLGTPPTVRQLSLGIYDPSGDRLVIYGGQVGSTPKNDAHVLALSGTPQWSALAPGGTLPTARRQIAGAYDSVNDRLLLYGGTPGFPTDVAALSLGASPAWSSIAPPTVSPPGRTFAGAAYDPSRQRFVAYGGKNAANGYLDDAVGLSTVAGAERWIGLPIAGAGPPWIGSLAGVLDTRRHRIVVMDPANPWALDLDPEGAWERIYTAGAVPYQIGRSVAYDSLADRMLLFGGSGGSNELWELSFTGDPHYTPLDLAGLQLPGRGYASTITDPIRRRMIVHGGIGALGSVLTDTWALPFDGPPVWTQISTPGPTPPMPAATRPGVYDAANDRFLLLDALDPNAGQSDSLWALSLGSPGTGWQSLRAVTQTSGLLQSRSISAIYDPARHRVIRYGYVGVPHSGGCGVLEADLLGSPIWAPVIVPPSPMDNGYVVGFATYDPYGDRMVQVGSTACSFCTPLYARAWALAFPSLVDVASHPMRPARASVRAETNPVVGRLVLRLTVPEHAAARLEVLDLAGRRVTSHDLSGLGPGEHVVRLDDTGTLPAGLYFARVRGDDFEAHARLCLVR